MTLPLLHLQGTPFEQGLEHGRTLKPRIAHNLKVYFNRFEREVGLSRAEVLSRAEQYANAIATQNPDYFNGMRGVSQGSGFSLLEVAALQVRYEILYFQSGKNAIAKNLAAEPAIDGCTAFAVLPEASANRHLLIGQNWDWIPQVQGAILHTTEQSGLETLSYTEAGIVGGKIGLNSVGIGLAINGMTSMDDDWSRLSRPFHVRCYEILRSPDFNAALEVVTGEDRACSTNFLIAQTPDKVVDIEASPNKVRLLHCQNGCLVHTNHFLDPAGMGIAEPPNDRRIFSYHRRDRLGETLGANQPVTLSEIEDLLRDHQDKPFSICRHEDWEAPPEEHYITVAAIVMDLEAKTLAVTEGPPCLSDFQTISLN